MNQVGVITTSYNQHEFLTQAVESVLAQTHQDFTLYVVNDYRGKPNSESVEADLNARIKDYGDSRINLVHNDRNLWISRARNVALRLLLEKDVTSVFFIDHDDIWKDAEKLRKQMEVLDVLQIGILWTQFEIIDEVNKLIGASNNPLVHETIRKSVLLTCPVLLSTMGVRSEVFKAAGLFDERYNGSDDWEFIIRTSKLFRTANLPDTTTHYRYYDTNTSQTQWHRLIEEHIRIIRETWNAQNGYYRALFIEYLKWLMPPKYRKSLKKLKKYIIPSYNTYEVN